MFQNRADAGRQLAEKLKAYEAEKPLIFALPRGGVPVGYIVSKALKAPLHVIIARKIGVPWQPELGVGAIAPGVELFNEGLLDELGLKSQDLKETIKLEEQEMKRRLKLYGGKENLKKIQGKTVILIDDGLATGISAQAALKSLKQWKPKKLILAVPVVSPFTIEKLKTQIDELICLKAPADFYAVGSHYVDFSQVSDAEVIDFLRKSKN